MRGWLRVAGLVFLSACANIAPPAPAAAPVAAMITPGYAFPEGAVVIEKPAPPIGLTASDGTGLRLVELEARAIVQDPLAFTQIHLVFDNPEDRRLEGTFSITLPDGAALSRFAMKLDDGWQEGEVVEKQAARRAYEDFLHRRQDPALLEQAAGNQFSARVFPIPARGRKEIVVAYSQEIPAGKTWALPLRGLPELGRLDVKVNLAGQADPVAAMTRTQVTPEGDFTLDPRYLRRNAGLRSGNLVLARVRPVPEEEADPLGATVVLVDTSGSRALGFEEEVRLTDALVRRIAATAGEKTKVAVAGYDQTTEAIFEGEAGAWGANEVRRLQARQALGASDLSRALGWAEARAAARGYRRVVLFGDGVATAGETAAGALAARAARLGSVGVTRLDVVAAGGIRDEAAMKRLATAGLPHDGVVVEATSGIDAIARRMALATRSGIPVAVEGARWSWPDKLDGVQGGDEVLVYADVPEGQPVRVRVGGSTGPALDLASVPRPLLERSVARAKIAALLALPGADPAPSVVREVVALSTRHRVLSPYTSMLVLETDADFARFSLDRKALADILAVEGGQLAVASRRLPSSVAPADKRTLDREEQPRFADRAPPRSAPEPLAAAERSPTPLAAPGDPLAARGNMWGNDSGDAFGAGGLGLAGVGTGGGGRGEGIGLGRVGTVGHGAGSGSGQGFGGGMRLRSMAPSASADAPAASAGVVSSTGSVLRGSAARVRRCYRAGLTRDASMAGRVAMRITIGANGEVTNVTPDRVTGLDATTVACITAVLGGLQFPPPEGGATTVVVPFTFSPGDTSAPPADRRPEVSPIDEPKQSRVEPYTGRFKTVMDAIGAGGAKIAVEEAFAWHREAPGDVMALVALGEALEASGAPATAARAYGSIVDLFPARADLRRFAGERMERVASEGALDLAVDTFAKAEEERPDHPESHRLLAFARLRRGEHAAAFAAAVRGIEQRYPAGRFRGVDQILREDLGLIAAAWIKAEPARREEILDKVKRAGGAVEDAPSLRFVLSWETDANDVDFHIEDAEGGHAYFRQPELPSGGRLYADVTTGYGPECFTIRLSPEQRSPVYKISAHYYSRGPMGYGMGKLEIIDHDGKGGLRFEERPFVVMADHAYVDLGTVAR
jgi:hypothetical protein